MVQTWNNHKILSDKRGLQCGRPIVMYEVPIIYNADSTLIAITQNELAVHTAMCVLRKSVPCEEDVNELCCHLMYQMNLRFPTFTKDV